MIPVQNNWLHIDSKFIHSCEQLSNNSYNNNLETFKQSWQYTKRLYWNLLLMIFGFKDKNFKKKI